MSAKHSVGDRPGAILHPTDFSPESEVALAHALRIALANHSGLSLLHISHSGGEHSAQSASGSTNGGHGHFPSVRKILERWAILPSGAHRSEVGRLGIGIEKVVTEAENTVHAIVGYLSQRPIDLLVMTTHGRHGLAALWNPSKAEQAARETHLPTLFVPASGTGCVDLDSGKVTMERVLVPVDHQPSSELAIEQGLRALQKFGDETSELILLHVGSAETFPRVQIPAGDWNIQRQCIHGSPVKEILRFANEHAVNLMVMVTEGTHGLLDVLRGTTTEQVLRESPCPVLAIPADF